MTNDKTMERLRILKLIKWRAVAGSALDDNIVKFSKDLASLTCPCNENKIVLVSPIHVSQEEVYGYG